MSTLTKDAIRQAGLTGWEYGEICRRLGRAPNPLELAMFGVMWSEHCGYKHSRRVLKRLPTTGRHVLQGPGENAGVLDVGGGWAVAWKMESHNHPSAVDPHNGAATGIGGILRDILSMGGRPVALLDSLRFGPPEDARSRRLLAGVVSGIAAYGNCTGVPTVGGEIHFEPSYRDNPLVNVVCLGLLRADRIATARAKGPGNPVIYAGARTGRDGIQGASFASTELDKEVDSRSSVQIGDPFAGKLLIEATLEALDTGAVVSLQDMGAGGITCATSEMAAKGGVGITLDLSRVPRREAGMTPEEVLLSESQERMLLVARRGEEQKILDTYRRWGLQAAVFGEIIADPVMRVYDGDARVVELPPQALADAPAYDPPAQMPAYLEDAWRFDADALPGAPAGEVLLALLADPAVASKWPVYQQYDHMVQVRTVGLPGGDAAVLRLVESPPRGLAIAVDGNGRYCKLDPYRGGVLAIAEVAANLACAGAEAIGLTDCLNFGSPERPEVFWTFREVIDGMAAACRALDIPVVGGNVSFYNEAGEGPIDPTPVVAAVGLMSDVNARAEVAFRRAGDRIVLLGGGEVTLGASLYLKAVHGKIAGRPPATDLDLHARLLRCMREAISGGLVSAAHDCSDGGVAVALAECCIAGGVGARATLPDGAVGAARAMFGEGPSRIIVAVAPEHVTALLALAAARGVPATSLGEAGGDRFVLSAGPEIIDLPGAALAGAWNSGLSRWTDAPGA
ncbi:MAG: phosphoribosylformylglycinamidine synthase subunit PurL [Armatimonadetes bacterium]|nr:phosphoribosylformylglycinamidine synthase subunit PurL [Armatimonadota bacterium]